MNASGNNGVGVELNPELNSDLSSFNNNLSNGNNNINSSNNNGLGLGFVAAQQIDVKDVDDDAEIDIDEDEEEEEEDDDDGLEGGALARFQKAKTDNE